MSTTSILRLVIAILAVCTGSNLFASDFGFTSVKCSDNMLTVSAVINTSNNTAKVTFSISPFAEDAIIPATVADTGLIEITLADGTGRKLIIDDSDNAHGLYRGSWRTASGTTDLGLCDVD